jgi:hypothetical protein
VKEILRDQSLGNPNGERKSDESDAKREQHARDFPLAALDAALMRA